MASSAYRAFRRSPSGPGAHQPPAGRGPLLSQQLHRLPGALSSELPPAGTSESPETERRGRGRWCLFHAAFTHVPGSWASWHVRLEKVPGGSTHLRRGEKGGRRPAPRCRSPTVPVSRGFCRPGGGVLCPHRGHQEVKEPPVTELQTPRCRPSSSPEVTAAPTWVRAPSVSSRTPTGVSLSPFHSLRVLRS